jgi:hypothetical protein
MENGETVPVTQMCLDDLLVPMLLREMDTRIEATITLDIIEAQDHSRLLRIDVQPGAPVTLDFPQDLRLATRGGHGERTTVITLINLD